MEIANLSLKLRIIYRPANSFVIVGTLDLTENVNYHSQKNWSSLGGRLGMNYVGGEDPLNKTVLCSAQVVNLSGTKLGGQEG